jgi:hypothetical protein
MFQIPADAVPVWLGVSLVSLTVFGVVVDAPTTTPPEAAALAQTVDSVAASPYSATAKHPLDARSIRLGPSRVALRNDGGTTHATFAYGPVTPAARDDRLVDVLDGKPPKRVFSNVTAFERAIKRAQNTPRIWRNAPETLVVRRVTWRDVNATLVG